MPLFASKRENTIGIFSFWLSPYGNGLCLCNFQEDIEGRSFHLIWSTSIIVHAALSRWFSLLAAVSCSFVAVAAALGKAINLRSSFLWTWGLYSSSLSRLLPFRVFRARFSPLGGSKEYADGRASG